MNKKTKNKIISKRKKQIIYPNKFVIKSKLRDKVLKLRKSKSKNSININPRNIYSYLKKKNKK